MAADTLKMDAVTLIAASRTNDGELTDTILRRHVNNPELVRAVADVAALLADTGATAKAITGYLDYVATATNGRAKKTPAPAG